MSSSPSGAARGFLRKPLDSIVFLLVVPLLAHFGFSWMGFNPSDDGFILAGSRRIAGGQVPHRDFISIRTAGSYVLHVPEVVFGGDHAFWISRYVAWLEWGVIAWCWVLLLDRLLALRLSTAMRFVTGLTIFTLCSHNAPISVWHTLDGLAATSLGLALCLGVSDAMRSAGFFLLGSAFLFKQGYAFMVPGALLLLGEWKRPRRWIAAAAPGALAGLALLVLGALPATIAQVGSRTEIISVGVETYLQQWAVPAGIALGALAMYLASRRKGLAAATGTLLLHAPALYAALALWRGELRNVPVYLLFGTAIGATGWLAFAGGAHRAGARVGALAVLTGWCVSISTAGIYKSPLMASGILAALLIAYSRFAAVSNPAERANSADSAAASNSSGVRLALLAPATLGFLVVAGCLAAFVHARWNFIYRERPAGELTRPLGDVFPGGRGIWTNPNTAAFLEDLRRAVEKTGGTEYAIIPALSGWWARAPQANPLSIDWAITNELHTPELVQRVENDIASRQGKLVVIVQRVQASTLAAGIEQRTGKEERNEVVLYVRDHLQLVDSTEFFDLYR